MKNKVLALSKPLVILAAAFAAQAASSHQPLGVPKGKPQASATLPFRVELVEVNGSKLPPLHSYTAAFDGRRWLLIGGRIAGLHGFNSGNNKPDAKQSSNKKKTAEEQNNFPKASQNIYAYVVDPESNLVLGRMDLSSALPPSVYRSLIATNQQSAQVGNDLYVIGGYGYDRVTNKRTTFGTITKINVHGLIQAILARTPIERFFAQNAVQDNRLKVTGGELVAADGVFYLVFGQNFFGDYSIENGDYNRAGGQFQQYTEKVRVFQLGPNLTLQNYAQVDGGYDPNLPYHRRDLNVVETILEDGKTPGATVYGGVFRAGQVAGHLAPIDIALANTPAQVKVTLQSNFKQALNHYNCARMTIFDPGSRSSYTTFFGGISQFHYDRSANKLIRDALNLHQGIDGLPFIDTVSTIRRGAGGQFAQFIQPFSMSGLLGTGAQFFPRQALRSNQQLFANGVIKLDKLSGRTLVGYVYGGIQSLGPYTGQVKAPPPSSRASRRIFQVFVTPGASAVIPTPPLPSEATPVPVQE